MGICSVILYAFTYVLKCCIINREKYSILLISLPLVYSIVLFSCSYLNKGNNAKEHKKSFLARFNKVSPDSEQTLLAQAQAYMKGNGFSSHPLLFSDKDIPGIHSSLAPPALIEYFHGPGPVS